MPIEDEDHAQTLALAALAGSVLLLLPVAASAQPAKTITIATHYNAEQSAPLRACLARYEAGHPDIRIELQQISYRDFLQTIVTSRLGGTAPDIYNVYSIWTPQLIEAGILAAPPAAVTDFVRANFSEGTVGAATIDGTVYGIPTELSVYLLLWNKRLFKEAGRRRPAARLGRARGGRPAHHPQERAGHHRPGRLRLRPFRRRSGSRLLRADVRERALALCRGPFERELHRAGLDRHRAPAGRAVFRRGSPPAPRRPTTSRPAPPAWP